MFARPSIEHQLATTWQAARTDGGRAQRLARRRRLLRLVRAPR